MKVGRKVILGILISRATARHPAIYLELVTPNEWRARNPRCEEANSGFPYKFACRGVRAHRLGLRLLVRIGRDEHPNRLPWRRASKPHSRLLVAPSSPSSHDSCRRNHIFSGRNKLLIDEMRLTLPLESTVLVCGTVVFVVEPSDKSVEVMRKFSEQYARRSGTYFCVDKGVTAVVIKVILKYQSQIYL
ncbi:hypothetical protein BHE74_00051019 [Ensete ventricosum]|nr:hypothetical protein BHE74_00051019 [Ensete ventricosum]